MAWTINDIRIYVEEDSGWHAEPRKGLIDLLDTNYSIIHTAGTPSDKREITFVVFSGYHTNILPLKTASGVVLEDDVGNSDVVSVMDVSPTRLYDYKGREIHRIKMDLVKDDAP